MLFNSDSGPSHPVALLGAGVTCLGTALTMLHRVPPAFRCARLADFRTQTAGIVHKSRFAAHHRRRLPAESGAVAVEPDAIDHRRDVLLTEAGFSAVFAFLGAAHAGFKARLMGEVTHVDSP